MDLTATEDLKLPLKRAWNEITDFDGFEKMLAARGVHLTRSARPDPPGEGTTWEGEFTRAGTTRPVSGRIVRFDAPHHLVIEITSVDFGGEMRADLTEGAQRRTHVAIGLHLQARSIKGRVFLQPLKLAHASIQARFAARVASVARSLEKRRRKV